MRRWIDMRAPLADMGVKLGEKSGAHRVVAFVVPINGFARFIRKTRPPRDPRRKFMRKIDIFLRRERLLNRPERWLRLFSNQTGGKNTNDNRERAKFHPAVLMDACTNDQQLPTTLNNF